MLSGTARSKCFPRGCGCHFTKNSLCYGLPGIPPASIKTVMTVGSRYISDTSREPIFATSIAFFVFVCCKYWSSSAFALVANGAVVERAIFVVRTIGRLVGSSYLEIVAHTTVDRLTRGAFDRPAWEGYQNLRCRTDCMINWVVLRCQLSSNLGYTSAAFTVRSNC